MSPKYSQVFLINKNIAERICEIFSSIANNNPIIEIGPGMGILTKFLYPKYQDKYTAIEIDPKMIEIIKKQFSNINIINSDFLKLNDEILNYSYFCGNLPYHISTAILEKIINIQNFKAAVFMFQKEVAKKITASVSDSEYGYLSALINITCDTEYLFNVSRYDFKPIPKVDSAVVKIIKKDKISDNDNLKNYQRFISAAFRHKRKTLLNSLSLSLKINKKIITDILRNKKLSLNIRAEEIPPQILFELSMDFKEFLN